jgi:hypothetical protein
MMEQLRDFLTPSADRVRKSTTKRAGQPRARRGLGLSAQAELSFSCLSLVSFSTRCCRTLQPFQTRPPSLQSYSPSPALLPAGRRPSPPSLLSRLVGSRLKTVCCQSSPGFNTARKGELYEIAVIYQSAVQLQRKRGQKGLLVCGVSWA